MARDAPAPDDDVEAVERDVARRAAPSSVDSASASRPSRVQAHVADVGAVAGDDLDDVVRLMRDAVRALVDSRASVTRAPSSTTTRTRVAVATAAGAARDEAQVQRASRRCAGGDADHRAVGHEGGVELVDGVVARRRDRAELGEQRMAGGERLGERRRSRRRPAGGRGRRPRATKWPLTKARRHGVDVGEGASPGRERRGDVRRPTASARAAPPRASGRAGRCT